MSGVVLRCPNCGTAQAKPGECEACHEGQVRHFCTNHKTGIWLDASTCPQCGARFGEAVRPAPLPAPAVRKRVPPKPAPVVEPGPWRADAPAPTGPGDVDYAAVRDALARRWLDRLTTASRMRRTPDPRRIDLEASAGEPVRGGCVKQVLMLVFILFALFVAASLLLGGALLGMV